MNDISKLPMWAQEHITRLERKATMLDQMVSAEWSRTETEYCLQRHNLVDRPLTMSFPLVPSWWLKIGDMEVRRTEDGRCEVRTVEGTIVVEPVCANVVNIQRRVFT